MNKIRRKALNSIIEQLQEIQSNIEEIMDEEMEYKDNMPENLQTSERYEKSEEACSAMQDAIAEIDVVIDYLNTATE